MRDWFNNLKIYSPGYQAVEQWGFDYSQLVDLHTALEQPKSVAAVPVFFDDPKDFAYNPVYENLKLDQFDLVLFTDIEFRRQTQILDWVSKIGCKNYLVCLGGLHDDEILHSRCVFRPSWSFNFLRWNQVRDDFPLERAFLFEALLGARREHRDYIMASMQRSGLLERSIVTYRDVFLGRTIEKPTEKLQQEFPDLEINWPYVSPNLDPTWEVTTEKFDHTVSSIVPWNIWNRCYYSIIAETIGHGNCFLMAEKIGKCCFARRLFVHFGVVNWLANLRKQGFETFGSVIDESYDLNPIDFERYQGAFDQVIYLSDQDPQQVLTTVKPILDHNHARLFEFRDQISQHMKNLILQYL